jgi:hypothetical protein
MPGLLLLGWFSWADMVSNYSLKGFIFIITSNFKCRGIAPKFFKGKIGPAVFAENVHHYIKVV